MQTSSPDLVSVVAVALRLLLLALPASTQCPAGTSQADKGNGLAPWYDVSYGEWMLYRDSCYKMYNSADYWYNAELTCQADYGHLVSIDSDAENRLVGRLSLCRDVWIGRYAIDLSKASDPSGYSWSDSKATSGYSRHNFNNFTERSTTHHSPLIRAANMYWFNSLYHEQHPFICEVPAHPKPKFICPPNTRYFEGDCYLLAPNEATFVEANIVCRKHFGLLSLVLSEAEMRFFSSLDLSTDSCQQGSLWVSLIRREHCSARPDRCWHWMDFGGNFLYDGFPKWADTEQVTPTDGNQYCGLLRGDRLYNAVCTEKHRFVCRIRADFRVNLTLDDSTWNLQAAATPATVGGPAKADRGTL